MGDEIICPTCGQVHSGIPIYYRGNNDEEPVYKCNFCGTIFTLIGVVKK